MHNGGHAAKISLLNAPALLDVAADRKSVSVDMMGYDSVEFEIIVGAIVNGGLLDVSVVEDANSNLAAATAITGAALTQITNVSNSNIFSITVHRPTKRYVGVLLEGTTANTTLVSVSARQYRGTGTNPPTPQTGSQVVVVAAN